MKNKLEACWLEWMNDFFTIQGYADSYGIELERAKRILSLGRKIHDRRHSLCHPCGSKGYHIETVIEADGTKNRTKVPCACCDGTGKEERR